MPRLVVPIDEAAGFAGFAMRVEVAIEGEDQRDVFGDLQVFGRHLDALRADRLDLAHEMVGVEHDAVADHRQLARPHDARGQQRELEDLLADDERVAGVMAALETHDHVGRDREPIDDLALAFVAPLGADHHHIRHRRFRLDHSRKNPGSRRNGLVRGSLRRCPTRKRPRSKVKARASRPRM